MEYPWCKHWEEPCELIQIAGIYKSILPKQEEIQPVETLYK
jgi:hypothetical protein